MGCRELEMGKAKQADRVSRALLCGSKKKTRNGV